MATKPHPHKRHPAESKVDLPVASELPPISPDSATLKSPDLYINRELSLLEFQCRVLEEAVDQDNPLLERVKFLAILGSNLDEFFMVRVAGLMKQVASGRAELGRDGRPATAQLQLIREKVRQIAGALMTTGGRKFSRLWCKRELWLLIRPPSTPRSALPWILIFTSTCFPC